MSSVRMDRRRKKFYATNYVKCGFAKAGKTSGSDAEIVNIMDLKVWETLPGSNTIAAVWRRIMNWLLHGQTVLLTRQFFMTVAVMDQRPSTSTAIKIQQMLILQTMLMMCLLGSKRLVFQ